MEDDSIVRLDGVSKTFRDFWLRPVVKAVDSLSLEIRRGEVFGLLGPNGSGKSTTIRMLLGLSRPDSGSVRLFGLPPDSMEARARTGYLPEQSYLHPFLTAEETILYYAGLSGLDRRTARRRTAELVEMVGLKESAKRRVGDFSKGMSRRVSRAAALVGKPSLLIMDEPTSGLDPVSTKEVKTLVKALAAGGMTVLTTSHLLADSEDICDRVAILDAGRKVAEGRIGELGQSLEDFFLAKVGNVSEFSLAEFLK